MLQLQAQAGKDSSPALFAVSAIAEAKHKPQEGPQEAFLTSEADIVIYGGQAGGGKSWSVIAEALKDVEDPEFGAVIFRRTSKQVLNEGGLWDEATGIFPDFGARPNQSSLSWAFPSGAAVSFAHLEHEKNKLDWQGAQIAYIGFDELTHFCMVPETEVLTASGWKRIGDVSVGESVASLDPGGRTVFSPVTHTWRFPYSGELVTVNQRNGVKFKVTPNHKLVVEHQGERGGWMFHDAGTAKTCSIPRAGLWDGGARQEWYTFKPKVGRGYGPNSNSADRVRMDDWLSFLGWWFAEGCAFRAGKRGTPIVSIRQTREEHKPTIRAVLERLPFRFRETEDGQFRIFSGQLFDELSEHGDAHVKRIPRWVFCLPAEQIRRFWDAFVDGDGCRDGEAIAFGLCNEGLVDDLQEVAFLLGMVASKGYQRVRGRFDVWRLNVSKPSRNLTMVHREQWGREHYEGDVLCLTVEPNHTFLARFEGRYFWTGNSETQFWYMLSRNRSKARARKRIRATCNPDVDSWVAEFIAWWIDQREKITEDGREKMNPAYGLPIAERAGRVRWFVRMNGKMEWGDTAEELRERFAHLPPEDVEPKSVTFIPAQLSDNRILQEKDPAYRANLLALPLVERERLLGGNWKARGEAGKFFNEAWFAQFADRAPAGGVDIRYWDKAGTEGGAGARSAGVRIKYFQHSGKIYVTDAKYGRWSALERESIIKQTAELDGRGVITWVEQEPGSGGKESAEGTVRNLAGHTIRVDRVHDEKRVRWGPWSAQAEGGNVILVRGEWNAEYIREHHNADPEKEVTVDMVDASSGAFTKAVRTPRPAEQVASTSVWTG